MQSALTAFSQPARIPMRGRLAKENWSKCSDRCLLRFGILAGARCPKVSAKSEVPTLQHMTRKYESYLGKPILYHQVSDVIHKFVIKAFKSVSEFFCCWMWKAVRMARKAMGYLRVISAIFQYNRSAMNKKASGKALLSMDRQEHEMQTIQAL